MLVFLIIGCSEKVFENNSSNKSRNQKWNEDIAYFENEYLHESKTFPKDSILNCKRVLSDLKSQIDSMTDNQIVLQLSRCIAMANNGHTTIHLSRMDKIPLRFYWFKEGLHIIKTDSDSKDYLGSKVLEINSIKIDSVLSYLQPYLSGIESFKKFTATNYLASPQILNGIGLTAEDSMSLTLLKGKDTLTASFKVKEMPNSKYEYESWNDLYPDQVNDNSWEYLLANNDSLPIYLEKMDEGVFYSFIDSEKIAYFNINALWYKAADFKGLIDDFLDELKSKREYDVVIDLRYYTGGNYLKPTKLATIPPKIIDKNSKIYLITSPMTFSAGLVTAARVKYFAKDKLVVVGEEVGDNLVFWAEGDYFKTPNFEIRIQDSKYQHDWKDDSFTLGKTFWVNKFYGVPAGDLKVDRKIELSYKDYLNRKDPILDWITNQK